ncbi:MAG: spoT-like ppGpp hydrolase [Pseudomonadota bacterium]
MRKSGEPYYSHPIIVARMVSDHIFRDHAIIAALLHDTLEDTTLTLSEIEQEFSPRIAQIVDRLTRKIDPTTGKKMSAGECLLKAHELGDVEVMIIKGFDRLHNMETIDSMSKEKQEKIALETLKFILPFIQEIDKNIEMSLNIISSKIIFPNNVDYLNKLYSKSFSSPNNYQLPSLNL